MTDSDLDEEEVLMLSSEVEVDGAEIAETAR